MHQEYLKGAQRREGRARASSGIRRGHPNPFLARWFYSKNSDPAAEVGMALLTTSVNELIDAIFGCYPSSKAAGVVPKGVPTIWHKSTACHLAHALKLL
jgi:hypothetical protein